MFYLGHFSFVESDDTGMNHGIFTAAVAAEDIDNATVKLHSLLEKQKESGLFDKYTFIFLEDIIEIRHMPEEGFIAHYSHYEGEPASFVSKSIPGPADDCCESYLPYPGFEPGIADEKEIVPFMKID